MFVLLSCSVASPAAEGVDAEAGLELGGCDLTKEQSGHVLWLLLLIVVYHGTAREQQVPSETCRALMLQAVSGRFLGTQ